MTSAESKVITVRPASQSTAKPAGLELGVGRMKPAELEIVSVSGASSTEVENSDVEPPSNCCSRALARLPCSRMQCALCCSCFTIILLTLIAIFYPRCVTVEMDSDSFKITQFEIKTSFPPAFRFTANMDVVVDNENFAGATVNKVQIEVKYEGIVLATTELNDVELAARDTTRIHITLRRDVGLAEIVSGGYTQVASDFQKDCGNILGRRGSGTNNSTGAKNWRLDVDVGVTLWSSTPEITFGTVYNVPCDPNKSVGTNSSAWTKSETGEEHQCLIPGSLGKE